MDVKQQLSDALQHPKTAAVVSAGTAGMGLPSAVFGLIPDDIGKLATLLATALTCVLIRSHLIQTRILQRKEKERLDALEAEREEEG